MYLFSYSLDLFFSNFNFCFGDLVQGATNGAVFGGAVPAFRQSVACIQASHEPPLEEVHQ